MPKSWSSKSLPFVAGRILDCGRNSGDWYDADALNRHLTEANSDTWCQQVVEEARELFGRWNWRQASQAPFVITGLVIASWLQSLWTWRPQVFVTGNSNTGKTVLLQDVIANGLFSHLGMFVEKPTEAAISQRMKHHGKVIFVDEFEKDSHRQRILELFRTTSRGGVKIRGTADHRGIEFRLRHIPWLSAVETGLHREADKNRYIILELDAVTPEKRAGFRLPVTSYLNDLGLRLLAVGLRHYQGARERVKALQSIEVEGVPARIVESFAVPLGVLTTVGRMDDAGAVSFMQAVLHGWDFTFQSSRDDVDVLMKILTSPPAVGRDIPNVSELLKRWSDVDSKMLLRQAGISIIEKRQARLHTELCGSNKALWICPDVVSRTILARTEYAGHAIDQYLLRLRGARRSQQRLGGDERFQGIEIPMDTVREFFEADIDDELQTSEF
ncbi:MAG TPA: hypothetical protein VGK58_06900 [Lacipirellulaceae bacterium]